MKPSFTKQFIRENAGCYVDKNEAFIYAKVNALDFMQGKESTPIPYTHILESGIPVKDKYWFFCKKVFTKEQNQNVAIGVAFIVLEIFENKYPNDDRPRKAIQAAQDYLDGVIDRETLMIARINAAYAAADATYAAAYAAYAAADAYAAATYAAADAHAAAYAIYAATAATYAATAATYAATAADIKEALLRYLIFFCEENL